MAAAAAREDGGEAEGAGASDELGLRGWLRQLPDAKGLCSRLRYATGPAWLTGVASRGIARRLRHHGYEVLSSESFLVEDSEGPLAEGELERAREWGAELVRLLAGTGARPLQASS